MLLNQTTAIVQVYMPKSYEIRITGWSMYATSTLGGAVPISTSSKREPPPLTSLRHQLPGKVEECLKKTPFWNIPQVNQSIENRWVPWLDIKGTSSKACISQARIGRGSPLCEQLCEQIVLQFKNNVSQHTIARNWGISSSTVHNVIKRFKESEEISAWKPT